MDPCAHFVASYEGGREEKNRAAVEPGRRFLYRTFPYEWCLFDLHTLFYRQRTQLRPLLAASIVPWKDR